MTIFKIVSERSELSGCKQRTPILGWEYKDTMGFEYIARESKNGVDYIAWESKNAHSCVCSGMNGTTSGMDSPRYTWHKPGGQTDSIRLFVCFVCLVLSHFVHRHCPSIIGHRTSCNSRHIDCTFLHLFSFTDNCPSDTPPLLCCA